MLWDDSYQQIAQTCNLKSDHNVYNYVQASQIELTYTYWFQMAITWKNRWNSL